VGVLVGVFGVVESERGRGGGVRGGVNSLSQNKDKVMG